MSEEKGKVAIDTDFFIKLNEKNTDGSLFLNIMDDLNLKPVMHRYVYEYELLGNITAKKTSE